MTHYETPPDNNCVWLMLSSEAHGSFMGNTANVVRAYWPLIVVITALDVQKSWGDHRRKVIVGRLDRGGNRDIAGVNIPYASTHFAERIRHTPLDLIGTSKARRAGIKRKGFAAYLADNCVPHREIFFDYLKKAAEKLNLGAVDALGKCHGLTSAPPESKRERYSSYSLLLAKTKNFLLLVLVFRRIGLMSRLNSCVDTTL
jgi:hypothetical protein